eukprot:TRINITY_DN13629_c0_g1_i3.p2 TRINITY_DN13629_c0_g1~~TRINITY_DN13629_c0_g1_i3.p2  ORF type:complete len:310 (-),score=67.18 TRINITY_DN13629_c0_g1_i3:408-1337(-)
MGFWSLKCCGGTSGATCVHDECIDDYSTDVDADVQSASGESTLDASEFGNASSLDSSSVGERRSCSLTPSEVDNLERVEEACVFAGGCGRSHASIGNFPTIVSEDHLRQRLADARARLPTSRGGLDVAPLILQVTLPPRITLDCLKAAFLSEGESALETFVREQSRFCSHCSEPWAMCSHITGARLRASYGTLQLPRDVPAAIARVCCVPDSSTATIVCRASAEQDSLDACMQVISHDVPFGERFNVIEWLSFRLNDDGVVLLRRWIEVQWTRSLGRPLRFIEHITREKVVSQARGMNTQLQAFLESFA